MISTHILDTSTGTPVAGTPVILQKQAGKEWKDVGKSTTNSDGRASFEREVGAHTYRIVFEVEGHFKRGGAHPFYRSIPVVFCTDDSRAKYHVPLLLNPFGYTTYLGS